ncbi:MspA family porin [Gordonia crocea]|uniref:MspA family protein n=1 Tax=Gordonia crocea TaxID=589162 RepID=A0A7I9UVL8_9ACTN|nr:MspA family porin [Gordonia crocea]GED96992.1 hypothetical protein nbrc107697_10310 [Gordonia crocea]
MTVPTQTSAVRRVAVLVAAAAVAITGAAATAPSADAKRLPGGKVARKLVDGTTVKATLYDEAVRYHPGNVANIQTSREVWVSGKIVANVGGGAQGGTIYGGYVVGCQVNIAGMSSGNSSGLDSTGMAYNQTAPAGVANTGTTLHLGPGQAGWVPIIQTTSGVYTNYRDYNVNRFTFRGNRGGVAFSQEAFRLNGCGGYASARARFTIEVETETVRSQVVVWGKPFSLG